jgi:tetratricopeptide (TPR) repeat protein
MILAALHEPNAAHVLLTENPTATPNDPTGGYRLVRELQASEFIALQAEDWRALLAREKALPQLLEQYPGFADTRPTMFDHMAALALAHIGQFTAAEARLKAMPGDCYPCLRARGKVAALQNQDARADFWFDKAITSAPSIPFAYAEWGAALVIRSQPDAAIEKFKLANQKSPHFADPLEGWAKHCWRRTSRTAHWRSSRKPRSTPRTGDGCI